jgi:all-trans-retinol 13,14-reductase
LKGLENSVSSFTLNVVFKKDSFPYFNTNYYIGKDGHVWDIAEYTPKKTGHWASLMFMAPSSKSPEFCRWRIHPGLHAL